MCKPGWGCPDPEIWTGEGASGWGTGVETGLWLDLDT